MYLLWRALNTLDECQGGILTGCLSHVKARASPLIPALSLLQWTSADFDHCRCRIDPSVDLALNFSLTCEQHPKVLDLLHLGQTDLPKNPKTHSLRFGGVHSHSGCFTFGCEPIQQELEVTE